MDEKAEYIIVTSCKNEEENLPDLINSVISQTLRPNLWVIVDDGSTDKTPQILRKAEEEHNWIKSIRLNGKERDLGFHLANNVKEGFNFAIDYCKKNNITYSYLANLDADLKLEETFYENIINEFEKDPKLGIASGGTKHIIGEKVVYAKLSSDEPSGGHMVIRRECFEDCEGIPISYAFDSVLKAKARLSGWSTKRFEDNLATEIRDFSSADGYWRGFKRKGKASHYLNLHPIHIGYKCIKYSLKRPYYLGFAYFLGYISSVLRRDEKISDSEVRRYFRNKWKKYVLR
ncbi:MAG: glycosyltransferase family 2 protein [bacterium]